MGRANVVKVTTVQHVDFPFETRGVLLPCEPVRNGIRSCSVTKSTVTLRTDLAGIITRNCNNRGGSRIKLAYLWLKED